MTEEILPHVQSEHPWKDLRPLTQLKTVWNNLELYCIFFILIIFPSFIVGFRPVFLYSMLESSLLFSVSLLGMCPLFATRTVHGSADTGKGRVRQETPSSSFCCVAPPVLQRFFGY